MRFFRSKHIWVMTTIVLGVGYAVSCTKDDQVLDTPQPVNSSTDLVSLKVATAPTLDGTIDAQWAISPGAEITVQDILGKTFITQESHSIGNTMSEKLDVNDLPKGTYIITIKDKDRIANTKFIKY